MGSPNENRLIPQPRAPLLQLEDPVNDRPSLAGGVVAPHEHRAAAAGPRRLEHERPVLRLGSRSDEVRHVEDRLERAEVALEPDDRGALEAPGQLVQMAGIGAAKAVDRLCVVPDDRESPPGRRQQPDDVDLEGIDVLVLVDKDMVEQARQLRADPFVDKGGSPVEEQVVEVELQAFSLAADICPAQTAYQLGVFHTPGEVRRNDVCDAAGGVHAPRVDVDERRRPRGPLLSSLAGQTVLLPQQIHHVCSIRRVENRVTRRQPEGLGVGGDHLVGDSMEGATPETAGTVALAAQRSRSGQHVVGRPPREGQQKDPFGRHPPLEHARHSGCQSPRLSCPCSCQYHKRAVAVGDRRQLCIVEPGVPGRCEHVFEANTPRPAEPCRGRGGAGTSGL